MGCCQKQESVQFRNLPAFAPGRTAAMSSAAIASLHRAAEKAAAAGPIVTRIDPPAGLRESLLAVVMRTSLKLFFRNFVRPPFSVGVQRAVSHTLSSLMLPGGGVEIEPVTLNTPAGPLPAERIRPRGRRPRHAILYLHGGAFCVCSPRSHRSITTRLARMADAEVLVPHYRRTPEHRFPAPVDDCLAAYRQLLNDGFAAQNIAVAGDSAGGTLTLWMPQAAELAGLPKPGVLVMLSPAVNVKMDSPSMTERAARDPMLHPSWGRQAMEWLAVDHDHPLANPMAQDFSSLPPTLVQVGEEEILYDDSWLFARTASAAGAHVELELAQRRWHVFQIHAGLMPGATAALQRQADFMRRYWA